MHDRQPLGGSSEGHVQRPEALGLLVDDDRRLDDGATPGFASLTESSRALVSEANFSFVRPAEESIHKIENPYREPALTLHVFGDDGAEQSYFDTKAKSYMTVASAWTLGV